MQEPTQDLREVPLAELPRPADEERAPLLMRWHSDARWEVVLDWEDLHRIAARETARAEPDRVRPGAPGLMLGDAEERLLVLGPFPGGQDSSSGAPAFDMDCAACPGAHWAAAQLLGRLSDTAPSCLIEVRNAPHVRIAVHVRQGLVERVRTSSAPHTVQVRVFDHDLQNANREQARRAPRRHARRRSEDWVAESTDADQNWWGQTLKVPFTHGGSDADRGPRARHDATQVRTSHPDRTTPASAALRRHPGALGRTEPRRIPRTDVRTQRPRERPRQGPCAGPQASAFPQDFAPPAPGHRSPATQPPGAHAPGMTPGCGTPACTPTRGLGGRATASRTAATSSTRRDR